MVAQTVAYLALSEKLVGLGIAVVVLGFIAGIILQITRQLRNMPAYFVANFAFFKGKHPKLPLVATIIYYIILAIPIILLIIWIIILGIRFGPNPALPILFIGLFTICIFLPSYSKLFYFKVLAMFITYVTAEMLMLGLVFQSQNPTSFWALTALSLTINTIPVIICLWFIDGSAWNIPENTPVVLKQKIRNSVKIWKQQNEPPEVIDGGLYGKVANLSIEFRVAVIGFVYVSSLIILAIYSVIVKYQTVYNFQGLVNSVAVVTTDVVICMLIFISKKTGFNPNWNALVVIAVRICLIAFSGTIWFAGYCLLYLILMLYISILIIDKYYPTHQKPPSAEVTKTNIFKMPESACLLLLIMFAALVYYVGQDGAKTLPVIQIQIGGSIYPFWAVGVSAILLSVATFFYLLTWRIVQRSRYKVRSINLYYLGCEGCGEYYFFLLISYIFLIILGFHLWSVVGRHIIWASCVFLPIFLEFFLIFYSNWVENDYLLFGDYITFNKKLKKKKQREDKINLLKSTLVNKMKEEGEGDPQMAILESSNLKIMDNAQVQQNFIMENYDISQTYGEWRNNMNIVEAYKSGKLLPTDKKIIVSLPVMIITLVAYSVIFFYSQNRDMTAFTVSVQILVLFLIFTPTIRYFYTFQKPNLIQIISFALGLGLNYAYGIIAYAVEWNNSPAYTVLWTVVNPFLVLTYAAFSTVRDHGLNLVSIILCVLSMLFSFGIGVILLAWFKAIAVGIALLAAAFFYSYFFTAYLIYKKLNNSVPFAIYPITAVILIGPCFVIMIYGFVSSYFDDFYGFSITYLVVNLLGLIYASYRVVSDILNRADKPNFYSPYGSPIYKYDFNLKSVVQNTKPLQMWLIFWFMFYGYSILMQIFIADTNYGTATSMIPLIVFSMTFIYIVTYNLYRGGKIKADITDEILEKSWQQVVKNQDRSLGNFLNLDQLEAQLLQAENKLKNGENTIKVNTVKIGSKQPEEGADQHNNTTTKIQVSNSNSQSVMNIDEVIYDLEVKIDKARQNDKILLVNFWTNIIFKTESIRKKRMLVFLNFIRDCGDILAQAGITLVINDSLYDVEMVYNQAFQELQTLSPLQRVFFNKQLKVYIERKEKEDKEKEDANRKQTENQIKRQKQLENKILNVKNQDSIVVDPNTPVEKLPDGPIKLKKLKQTLQTSYSDTSFQGNNDVVPSDVRSLVKGWKRPSQDSFILNNSPNISMAVRQGMIGNCYLISAIGVLGRDRIKEIIVDSAECPPGCYMVKFNKFNKDIYIIVDDYFPVEDVNGQNKWLFGRCEDEKELFCNILEKAYAKLYGGYQNIVGGKVALALSDMTGGFPEQIELKPYQETNTSEIFDKMLKYHQAGYLMGAGSPPNTKGDSVQIDGIYQGHAYLILNVRNLDGNKLIKLRNPHGNNSKESTLDWSDDSPKWTARLKGLLGETMADDGAFWMGLDDFVYCFRALYVCRIFDNSWLRLGPFNGAWRGPTAAGLKTETGTAVLTKNPHYGIKVSKACTLFIQLTQNQILPGGKPKNKIFFMVQRNGGKRIEAPATNKMVGMSGPAINSRTISKEINLTADSFPYTFSLLVAIYQAGAEGSYSLSMYCNDKSIQIIEDSAFDQ